MTPPIEKVMNLIHKEARKMTRACVEMEVDDWYQEGIFVYLTKAKERYESSRSSFNTFLVSCIRRHFISLLRKQQKEMLALTTEPEETLLMVPAGTYIRFEDIKFIEKLSEKARTYLECVVGGQHADPTGRTTLLHSVGQELGFSYKDTTALKNEIMSKAILL